MTTNTNTASAKTHYAKRDAMALDLVGGYYMRHVMALTREGLHAKSDIAAELAHRDMEIDRLRAALSTAAQPPADTWAIAESVRTDLDRQSCPGVYMDIAVESIVKHLAAAPKEAKAEPVQPEPRIEWIDRWQAKHSVSLAGAKKHLQEFLDEWPGGFEEIESALKMKELHSESVQPERVPLTDRQISDAYFEALGAQHLREQDRKMVTRFARAIEQAHGIQPAHKEHGGMTIAGNGAAELVHELDARIRAAAVAAYATVHGFAPAMDFAPDRAWLEGYSAALATQPQEAAPSQDAEDAARSLFDAGWKAAAMFCDRDDVVADGIVGGGGCPQFEKAYKAARAQEGK